MPTFSYKAVDGEGKSSAGTLVAESRQAAFNLLNERALFPVHIDEGGEAAKSTLISTQRRVKLRHVAGFYGQLRARARSMSRPKISPQTPEVTESLKSLGYIR